MGSKDAAANACRRCTVIYHMTEDPARLAAYCVAAAKRFRRFNGRVGERRDSALLRTRVFLPRSSRKLHSLRPCRRQRVFRSAKQAVPCDFTHRTSSARGQCPFCHNLVAAQSLLTALLASGHCGLHALCSDGLSALNAYFGKSLQDNPISKWYGTVAQAPSG